MSKKKRKKPGQERKALKRKALKERNRKEEKRKEEEMMDVMLVEDLDGVGSSDSIEENSYEAMALLLQAAGASNIRPDKGYKRTMQAKEVWAEGVEDILEYVGIATINPRTASLQKHLDPNNKYTQMFTVCFDAFRAVADVDGHKCTACANIFCGDPDLGPVSLVMAERDDGCIYNPATAKWEKTAGQLPIMPVNYFTTDMVAAHRKAEEGVLTSEQAGAILKTGASLILTVMRIRMTYPHKVCFGFGSGYSSLEKAAVGDLVAQNNDHHNSVLFGIQVCPSNRGSAIRVEDEKTEEIKDLVTLNSTPVNLPEEVNNFIKKYWH